LSVEFESQTRIRIARAVRNAAIAQTSLFAANLECGVHAVRGLGYPQTYPKKVVAAAGSPRMSLEHRWTRKQLIYRVFGHLLDVYGRPWKSLDVLRWLPGPDSKSGVSS
jgi:hypothetical protein